MNLKINGKFQIIDNAADILALVAQKGLSQERIVVEHNYEVIPREKWPEIALSDNDNIEIVSFVGGG
jgi:sulfur carrier protein